jgi:hypothetical protein
MREVMAEKKYRPSGMKSQRFLLEREAKLSGLRVMALTVLMTPALGIALVDNALAGEKAKCRGVKHMVQWDQIHVGN